MTSDFDFIVDSLADAMAPGDIKPPNVKADIEPTISNEIESPELPKKSLSERTAAIKSKISAKNQQLAVKGDQWQSGISSKFTQMSNNISQKWDNATKTIRMQWKIATKSFKIYTIIGTFIAAVIAVVLLLLNLFGVIGVANELNWMFLAIIVSCVIGVLLPFKRVFTTLILGLISLILFLDVFPIPSPWDTVLGTLLLCVTAAVLFGSVKLFIFAASGVLIYMTRENYFSMGIGDTWETVIRVTMYVILVVFIAAGLLARIKEKRFIRIDATITEDECSRQNGVWFYDATIDKSVCGWQ